MLKESRKWLWIAPWVVTVAVLAGCGPRSSSSAKLDTQAAVSATLVTLQTQRLPIYATFPGTVRDADHVEVASRIMGYVKALNVHEGESVHAGQLLLTIDPTEVSSHIAQARAQLDKAEAALANAATNEHRYQALFAQQAVPAQQYQQVQLAYRVAKGNVAAARAALASARQQRQYAEVRAPFAGTVVAKTASQGQLAAPGQPLLTLEGAAHLQVTTQLSNQAFDAVRPGQVLTVEINGFKTRSLLLKATVERLVSAADPITHTHTVKLDLPAKSPVQSGAYARVRVEVGHHQGIVIPATAIHIRGGIEGVFVADKAGIAHFRMVRLGHRLGDGREVLAGLVSGERVIVTAHGELDNGVPVKAVAGS